MIETLRVHDLKCDSRFFELVPDHKGFELRPADRDFRPGDYILLREGAPVSDGSPTIFEPTGRTKALRILRVWTSDALGAYGLRPGFVVMEVADAVTAPEGEAILGRDGTLFRVERVEPRDMVSA